MNSKELSGLQESYLEVVKKHQLDEASPIYSRGGEQRRTQTPRQIGVKGAPHNIPKGGTTISDRDPEGKRLFTGDQDRGKGNKAARRAAALKPKEKRFPNRLRRTDGQGIRDSYEYDLYDIILSHLLDEGYAETPEEALDIMVNMDEECKESIVEEILDEAEGSYGQTPKARSAMSKLTIDRMHKPASEYSQRGEKTKKVKAGEKHARRQDVLSRGLSGGKKSSRPSSGRGEMDADERAERRAERAFDGENTYGAGSVTKNPKKLRKQKAMGEIKESYDAYDFVLSYLLDEGFASTEDAADKIILNMSEAWFEDIMERNRYEKETGKDYKTGKEVKKGGTMGGDDTHSKVMRHMHKVMGAGRMGAGGAIRERGKKKEKGGSTPGPSVTPAQKVAKRRADVQKAQDMMHSARD